MVKDVLTNQVSIPGFHFWQQIESVSKSMKFLICNLENLETRAEIVLSTEYCVENVSVNKNLIFEIWIKMLCQQKIVLTICSEMKI